MVGKCWCWQGLPDIADREREIKIAAYEVASGDKISDAVRVATIMKHAPEPMKGTLCQSPSDQRRSVDALKLWI